MNNFLLLTLALLFSVSQLYATAYGDNKRGNKHFKNKKYNEAISDYTDALNKKKDRAEVMNNQANCLHKLNDNESAIQKYQEALKRAKSDKLKSRIFYNMGNAFAKEDKMKEAVNSYMNALKFNPNDQDAKYNLELARILMQTNNQQQQQEQQGDGKGDDKKDKKKGDKEKQKGEDEKEQRGDPDQQDDNKESDKDKQKKPKPGEMSKDEAENVLDAVLNDEKNTQRKAKMEEAKRSGKKNTEKDW